MNKLTKDFIAIDTNIFMHILNPQKNTDEHIDQLLEQLSDDGIKLLVDDGERIINEYSRCLDEMIEGMELDSRQLLLLYWLDVQNHKSIKIIPKDTLMISIKKIIPPKKGKSRTDCYFVYVAFKEGRILITHDEGDIGKRCEELFNISKKRGRKKGSDILTSCKAYKRLQG